MEESPEIKRQTDWQDNHIKIGHSLIKLTAELKKRPTIHEMAEDTGLSNNTVFSHLKELRNIPFEDRINELKILSDKVVFRLYETAVLGGPGSVAAAKLYFQIVENWKPGLSIELKEKSELENSTVEELLEKYGNYGNDINRKLLRFARTDKTDRKTG